MNDCNESWLCIAPAKARIAELEAEVERLRKALAAGIARATKMASTCEWYGQTPGAVGDPLTHEYHSDAHDACHAALEILAACRAPGWDSTP